MTTEKARRRRSPKRAPKSKKKVEPQAPAESALIGAAARAAQKVGGNVWEATKLGARKLVEAVRGRKKKQQKKEKRVKAKRR